ncbi:MAG: nickel pincer cofactor biosynthesis protein LarC [Bacillota bacterium]
MRVAYFDCFHGAAGDMMVGALLDAGLPFEAWRRALAGLGLSGYSTAAEKVTRGGLTGTWFSVKVDDPAPPHRHLGTIIDLIDRATLPERVKEQAKAVFTRLGQVEAAVHGVPVEKVHFHEVGAIDSLVDIVGTLVGLEMMGVERVYSSVLTLGAGTVQTAHGLLPVPAPATARLVEGFPVRPGPAEGELLTPTAAALLTSLAAGVGDMPAMRVEGVGYGAGTRQTAVANLLRVFIGEVALGAGAPRTKGPAGSGEPSRDEVVVLEANIDNSTPELLGYASERLFAKGALDVYSIPIGMKKSRPGVLLGVIAPTDLGQDLARVILEETSTIGVRSHACQRWVCPREVITVDTTWGPVRVKVSRLGETRQVAPEFEDCRALALSSGVPFKTVSEAARASAWTVLNRR